MMRPSRDMVTLEEGATVERYMIGSRQTTPAADIDDAKSMYSLHHWLDSNEQGAPSLSYKDTETQSSSLSSRFEQVDSEEKQRYEMSNRPLRSEFRIARVLTAVERDTQEEELRLPSSSNAPYVETTKASVRTDTVCAPNLPTDADGNIIKRIGESRRWPRATSAAPAPQECAGTGSRRSLGAAAAAETRATEQAKEEPSANDAGSWWLWFGSADADSTADAASRLPGSVSPLPPQMAEVSGIAARSGLGAVPLARPQARPLTGSPFIDKFVQQVCCRA